jgi:competence protein ComEA
MAESGDGATPTSDGGLQRLGRTALLGLSLLALAGGVALLVLQRSPGGVELILPTPTPRPTLQVYLSGAVARPGVYTFQRGERLADALAAAGGATSEADLTVINLALRLRDQDQFHVPRAGEAPRLPARLAGGGNGALVDLNWASAEELQTLPGIGPARAADIVEYREAEGRFEAVEELLAVSGIGPATLEGLRDLVTVE